MAALATTFQWARCDRLLTYAYYLRLSNILTFSCVPYA